MNVYTKSWTGDPIHVYSPYLTPEEKKYIYSLFRNDLERKIYEVP